MAVLCNGLVNPLVSSLDQMQDSSDFHQIILAVSQVEGDCHGQLGLSCVQLDHQASARPRARRLAWPCTGLASWLDGCLCTLEEKAGKSGTTITEIARTEMILAGRSLALVSRPSRRLILAQISMSSL